MADMTTIAQQFTQFYYNTFDTNRSQLGPLYRDHSMMTWEGAQVQGVTAILEKLTSLPFQKVEHQITTIDAQPSSLTAPNLIVSVIGQLKVDDGEHPLQFSQTFQLIQDQGSFYVFNDIFRLNYG